MIVGRPASGIGRGTASHVVAAAAIGWVALGGAFAAASPEPAKVPVRGRITGEKGEGVPGQTVRLLKSRTFLKLGGMKSLDQSVEEKRVVTDSLGFFGFE